MRFPIFLLPLLIACESGDPTSAASSANDTTGHTHDPRAVLRGLQPAEGLELTLVAAEPMLKNPTNMDVDHRGRIWITEAYNYRPDINGNPTTPRGDRIVILEDVNGDGQADTSKVFYQGPELASPLGVAVLGNRVLVSQSPYVWAFWDDDGDDQADRKEVLFQGIGGEQHDHGVHSFSFGPDGWLYFTMGNEGRTLLDAKGRPVRDRSGRIIGPPHFRQGMALRCRPDGSEVEVLGHNFRNNYEAAPDAFGALWQSDNDDDGNRATRLNFVMPGGNYGYTDERTGAGWNAPRTAAEDSVPLRHWHQADPGVVPNLLQTGSGSPAGLTVYEGTLLPQRWRGAVLHCDPGVNALRAYRMEPNGAGYTTKGEYLINGSSQPWFRPVDICTAPDGSLLIADWYDPGVGGHAAGDQQRGRIYRLAPKGYRAGREDNGAGRPPDAVAALQSPNSATRYLGWTALDSGAVPRLRNVWDSDRDPGRRARAFWALWHLTGDTALFSAAFRDPAPELRMMALRAAERNGAGLVLLQAAARDPHPGLRREAALALRHRSGREKAELWAQLAAAYRGGDRWMLEALGIGAANDWPACLSAYLQQTGDPMALPGGKDIIWRARAPQALPLLTQLAGDSSLPIAQRHRYFRAFDFHDGPQKETLLLSLLGPPADTARNALVLRHLGPSAVTRSPGARAALTTLVAAKRGSPEYLLLTERYRLRSEAPELLRMAVEGNREAARLLLGLAGTAPAAAVVASGDTASATRLIEALGGAGSDKALDFLQKTAYNAGLDTALRYRAAAALGWSWGGEERVIALLRSGKVPPPLVPHLVRGVSGAWRGHIRTEAQTYLPPHLRTAGGGKAAPALARLNALDGEAEKGRPVFTRLCATCHVAATGGQPFGPALSETGSKLSREALYEAIVRPSAGIAFGYEGQAVRLRDGSMVSGILSSRTADALLLRFPGGSSRRIAQSEVASVTPLDASLMPDDLHSAMSEAEFAHLLRFLEAQKKAAR